MCPKAFSFLERTREQFELRHAIRNTVRRSLQRLLTARTTEQCALAREAIFRLRAPSADRLAAARAVRLIDAASNHATLTNGYSATYQ